MLDFKGGRRHDVLTTLDIVEGGQKTLLGIYALLLGYAEEKIKSCHWAISTTKKRKYELIEIYVASVVPSRHNYFHESHDTDGPCYPCKNRCHSVGFPPPSTGKNAHEDDCSSDGIIEVLSIAALGVFVTEEGIKDAVD